MDAVAAILKYRVRILRSICSKNVSRAFGSAPAAVVDIICAFESVENR